MSQNPLGSNVLVLPWVSSVNSRGALSRRRACRLGKPPTRSAAHVWGNEGKGLSLPPLSPEFKHESGGSYVSNWSKYCHPEAALCAAEDLCNPAPAPCHTREMYDSRVGFFGLC